jgi:hypothetical protein
VNSSRECDDFCPKSVGKGKIPCIEIAENIKSQIKGWHEHRLFDDHIARFIFIKERGVIFLTFDCRTEEGEIAVDSHSRFGSSHETHMGVTEESAKKAAAGVVARATYHDTLLIKE